MYNIVIPWCLFSGVWGCASWDRWSGNWLASDHLTDDPQTAKEMPGVARSRSYFSDSDSLATIWDC
jgi:hypothetical protein